RAVHASLAGTRRGDVLEYRRGRRTLWALVLDVDADRLDSPILRVLTPEPRVRTLTSAELPQGATTVATVPIPKHANLRDAGQRRDLAARLRSADQSAPPAAVTSRAGEAGPDLGEQIHELRPQPRAPPCLGDSDRADARPV